MPPRHSRAVVTIVWRSLVLCWKLILAHLRGNIAVWVQGLSVRPDRTVESRKSRRTRLITAIVLWRAWSEDAHLLQVATSGRLTDAVDTLLYSPTFDRHVVIVKESDEMSVGIRHQWARIKAPARTGIKRNTTNLKVLRKPSKLPRSTFPTGSVCPTYIASYSFLLQIEAGRLNWSAQF